MKRKLLELHCKKDLIDSAFEGYKLSLNEIPRTFQDLPVAVRQLQYNGDSFSFLSVALHSMHDHLISDPWYETLVYFIDESMKVIRVSVNPKNNTVKNFHEVLQLSKESSRVYRYNASVVFSDMNTALVADGSGIFHVLNTGDRESCQNWTTIYSCEILGENNPFTILDACCIVKDNFSHIHCLLTAIEEEDKEPSTLSRASTAVFWVELLKNYDCEWEVNELFKITTPGVVKYGYFDSECKCLFIEATESLTLSNESDSLPSESDSLPTVIQKDPEYFWKQSSDDIKILCALPKNCAKEDVKIDISGNSLNIAFKSDTLLSGETFHRLDPKLTTWNITDNRLELTLSKQNEGQMWQYLMLNDDRGEEVMDPVLVGEIHERLAHLCSDKEAPVDDPTPTFNPGQLEACDNIPDENSRLFVIDTEMKKIVKEINLSGHQKLFNIRLKPIEPPCLCIRHDVDGLLWKLDFNSASVCEHIGTLNAFGYVLASKQWKYSTCSPDLSYAVIAAAKQNLFLYKQNCNVDSELRNRKTNQKFCKVGKQYLIILNSSDEILGIRAAVEFLLVLTKTRIYLFDMKGVK